jgi:hypothetical protein
MSDLHADFQGHRELPPLADGVDVVIVAGDTCEGLVESLEMLRAAYPSPVEIVAVAGNHEFYSQVHRVELARGRECASSLGIHLLENDCVMLGSVRIVGATLWMSNRIQPRPPLASKNDPTPVWCNGAETGGAEPHIAEQSRSWRAASGERKVMRGS